MDVRFDAHNGLNSDIAPCPKSGHSRRFWHVRSMSDYGVISEMPVVLFCRLAWAGAIGSVRNELATQPDGQIRAALANLPVQSPQRKYFTSRVGQITSRTSAVLPHRGVLRNVINAGRDEVDAGALLTDGADADGEVVWS